jgi:hypothetical protein
LVGLSLGVELVAFVDLVVGGSQICGLVDDLSLELRELSIELLNTFLEVL